MIMIIMVVVREIMLWVYRWVLVSEKFVFVLVSRYGYCKHELELKTITIFYFSSLFCSSLQDGGIIDH
jgi:hypothetical protein